MHRWTTVGLEKYGRTGDNEILSVSYRRHFVIRGCVSVDLTAPVSLTEGTVIVWRTSFSHRLILNVGFALAVSFPGLTLSAQVSAPQQTQPPQNAATTTAPQQAQSATANDDSEEPAPKPSTVPTQDEIQQYLSTLDSAVVDEADKQKATEYLQKALAARTLLEQQQAEKAKYERLLAEYEKDPDEFKQKLAELPAKPPAVDEDKSLAELEAEITTREADLQQLRTKLDESNKQFKTRSAYLANYSKLVADTQQELDQVNQQLEKFGDSEATDVVSRAEQLYLRVQQEALQATLDASEKHREYYAKSGDYAQSRRDYRAKKLALDEKYLAALREVVNQERQAEANQQASAAASAAAIQRPKAIADLANANAALAKDSADVVAKIAKLDEELDAASKDLHKVQNAKDLAEERADAAGRTEAMGQQLRQQQEMLPHLEGIARQIALLQEEKSAAVYSKYKLLEQRNEVEDADMDERVDAILQKVPPEQRASSEKEVRSLLESERKILSDAKDHYEKYVTKLNELIVVENDLITTTREYREFIAKEVLWIRSCSWPRLDDLQPAARAVAWSFNLTNWQAVLEAFWNRSDQSPIVLSLFAVLFIASLYYQNKLRRRLREIGEQAAKRTCTEFHLSFEALWITALMALPWPALLWFVGWWIDSPLNESEFVRALAVSLQFVASCFLLLELIRHVCRSGGLADAHFGWPQSCLAQVRRNVRGLLMIGLPLMLWLAGLEVQNVEVLWSTSLGRACFVVVAILLAWVCYRVLIAANSPFRQLLIQSGAAAENPLRQIWAPIVAGLPILLALLAVVGYYYTAQQLSLRLLESTALVLVLLVAGGLTKRWIVLNRRRLAREQARQKRAAAQAAAEAAKAAGEEAAPLPPEALEETVDLTALGEQTNKLVVTVLTLIGLVSAWFIWEQMLPALTSLSDWPVFPREDVLNPLTWGNVLLFVLMVIVTYVVVENVPALLEFAVLQRLPLESGLRYAITSVCRYLIVAVGIYMAYTSLGFDPTSIGWLVAAMGVGLGFGLQEIFANFVSGIILLFERPIRVGDIVTLGDTTGLVTRIRMRATTIVDWDRKEYIVPNKDLVTERLLNWTLTDQTNRIVINVGVAYGSDTDLACRLLKEVAAENQYILDDPDPLATFEGFGDSTLNLVLRAYLPNLEKRLQTIHDLHSAIDQKFKEAEIEIAFPQTDIHVRTVPQEWLQQSARSTTELAANGKKSRSE